MAVTENSAERSENTSVQGRGSSHDAIYALRTIHQNQTQINLMADQKANILLGIHVVILTILLSRLYTLPDMPMNLIPALVTFLVLVTISFVTGLGVIIPKGLRCVITETLDQVPNLFFFGFFTRFQEQEYVDFMQDQFEAHRARELLIVDIYQIGLVLKQKYKLLKYAYIMTAFAVITPLLIIAVQTLLS